MEKSSGGYFSPAEAEADQISRAVVANSSEASVLDSDNRLRMLGRSSRGDVPDVDVQPGVGFRGFVPPRNSNAARPRLRLAPSGLQLGAFRFPDAQSSISAYESHVSSSVSDYSTAGFSRAPVWRKCVPASSNEYRAPPRDQPGTEIDSSSYFGPVASDSSTVLWCSESQPSVGFGVIRKLSKMAVHSLERDHPSTCRPAEQLSVPVKRRRTRSPVFSPPTSSAERPPRPPCATLGIVTSTRESHVCSSPVSESLFSGDSRSFPSPSNAVVEECGSSCSVFTGTRKPPSLWPRESGSSGYVTASGLSGDVGGGISVLSSIFASQPRNAPSQTWVYSGEAAGDSASYGEEAVGEEAINKSESDEKQASAPDDDPSLDDVPDEDHDVHVTHFRVRHGRTEELHSVARGPFDEARHLLLLCETYAILKFPRTHPIGHPWFVHYDPAARTNFKLSFSADLDSSPVFFVRRTDDVPAGSTQPAIQVLELELETRADAEFLAAVFSLGIPGSGGPEKTRTCDNTEGIDGSLFPLGDEELRRAWKAKCASLDSHLAKVCLDADGSFGPVSNVTFRRAAYLDYIELMRTERSGEPILSFQGFCETFAASILFSS